MTFPVRTVSRPACLNGQTNGQLDPAILVDTPVPYAVWPCRLVTPAARSWRALAAAALQEGHTLKPSGPSDSYRPYEVQERIFLQRFTVERVSRTVRTWRGKNWYLRPGYALAAVPGTSNHGWGLAVDVGEETDGDTGTESIDRATVDWLVANEERFGFSHEVQSEPWHIRYFSGDHIPAAVLDHEDIAPPPLPLPLEEPMLIRRKSNPDHAMLFLGGKLFEAHGTDGEGPKFDDGVWNAIIREHGPVIAT